MSTCNLLFPFISLGACSTGYITQMSMIYAFVTALGLYFVVRPNLTDREDYITQSFLVWSALSFVIFVFTQGYLL